MAVSNKVLWLVAGALCLNGTAQAGLYKWVDQNGKVQYSDSPPQQPHKSVAELSKDGVVLRQTQVLTPEQQKAKDEADAKKRAEELKVQEQQRRDRALLNSFTDPKEIDLIRDRNIDQVLATIASYESRRKTTEKRMASLDRSTSEQLKKTGKVPADMLNDSANTRNELQQIDKQIAERKLEIEQIKQRAEEDKKRLVELRSHNKLFEERGMTPPAKR